MLRKRVDYLCIYTVRMNPAEALHYAIKICNLISPWDCHIIVFTQLAQ